MQLHNFTTFSVFSFVAEAVDRTEHHVVVVKGTFDLVDGEVAARSDAQAPLWFVDEYHGDPVGSSLRLENDLAAHKPATDVYFIDPVARPPRGRLLSSWLVRVRIGALEKRLRAVGPRTWTRRLMGWRLGDPMPCSQVDLRYESAFGGVSRHGDEVAVHEQNPVGRGFLAPRHKAPSDTVIAPQVEAVAQPITSFGAIYPVEGLGPIGRSWLPRRACAGTFDRGWMDSKWPGLPDDFSYSFCNAAPRGLVAPSFLRGDEPMLIEGMDEGGSLDCRLPGCIVFALARYDDGAIRPFPMPLDTLAIDVGRRKCYLTWRLGISRVPSVRVVETRLTRSERA